MNTWKSRIIVRLSHIAVKLNLSHFAIITKLNA